MTSRGNVPAVPIKIPRGMLFRPGFVLAALAAVAIVGLPAPTATADTPAKDPAGQKYPITQVSYTTGEQGNKLKWLPYRPAPGAANRQAAARQVVKRLAHSPAKPLLSNHEDPFSNPFGDAEAGPAFLLPAVMVDEQVLQKPKPAMPLAKPPAKPRTDQPAAKDEKSARAESSTEPIPPRALVIARGGEIECPLPGDLKKINEITNDVSAKAGEFPKECTLTDEIIQGQFFNGQDRSGWAPTTFTWKASGLCHKPLYFEEVHLERYGHSWGPYLQPVISGGHFFLTIPALPYLMGLNPPNECIYTLGYYRPGSCAPYLLDPLPISVRAGLAQAGVLTGMVYLIP